jgi:hypothetical protein
MPSSIHRLSVPVFLRGLAALSRVIGTAEAHAAEHKIEPAALLTARLFPDMFPLTRQVQIGCDTAKRSTARLANVEAPSFEDDETTFAQLATRIDKTAAFIEGVKADHFLGAEDRIVEMKMGATVLNLNGLDYLTRFALPNFYFHVATAYDICRHNGVVLGKKDFLGSLETP